MPLLSEEIQTLVQRVGANAGKLRTETERAAFVANVRSDLANIIYQYNNVLRPLLASLPDEILETGLNGAHLYTHSEASSADAIVFYSSTLARQLTIKESFDVLSSEVSRIENLITNIDTSSIYDDSALVTSVDTLEQDIAQLAEDTMGANYTLDGDGAPNLTYSLAQIVDAIGAFFAGYTPSGNTYSTTYPAISFSGDTLQGAYDSGSTDAGEIELENAKGHLIIKDDPIAPLDTYLEWKDDTAASLGELNSEGLLLKTDTAAVTLSSRSTEPTVASGYGAMIVMDDGTSGDPEMHYHNSIAPDVTQVTRDGLVKELEIGSDWITPLQMQQTSTPPSRNNIVLGVAPTTDMEYAAVQLPDGSVTLLYVSLARPKDEDGNFPSRAYIQIFAAPTTNPGAGPYAYSLNLHAHDTGAPEIADIIGSSNNLTPLAWALISTNTSSAINMPGDLNRLDEHGWLVTMGSSTGLLPLKIERDSALGSDTFIGEVSILGMRITWYR